MKVKELREALQSRPDDSDIVIDMPKDVTWGTYDTMGVLTLGDKDESFTSIIVGKKIWPVTEGRN
ncbi:MAG: hypothetical protein PUB49_05205 [Selenomonadaceae bacterium]|nr:hypothetical protein [Selenomonadaceae bacterium]